jgi:hypothetical protein
MDNLKDPMSAQISPRFRRVKGNGLVGWTTDEAVCMTVNANNSFGGYTGAQPFVYVLNSDKLYEGNGAALWCGT